MLDTALSKNESYIKELEDSYTLYHVCERSGEYECKSIKFFESLVDLIKGNFKVAIWDNKNRTIEIYDREGIMIDQIGYIGAEAPRQDM